MALSPMRIHWIGVGMHGPIFTTKSHMSSFLKHVPTVLYPSVAPSSPLSSCCLLPIGHSRPFKPPPSPNQHPHSHSPPPPSSSFSSFPSHFNMIKTLSPYTNDNTKTAEILSRYRPIAPKPVSSVDASTNETPMSSKIMQSPYLKHLWPQLQNKPTRTRKRGRGGLSLPPLKKARPTTTTAQFFSLSSPNNVFLKSGHVPSTLNFENPVSTTSELVTLPLLPCLNPSSSHVFGKQTSESSCMEPKIQPGIDLNAEVAEVSEEKDFLKLYHPGNNLVTPKPVRPVGSTICVGYISELVTNTLNSSPKKREEVEREVESENLPTVVSDSNNRVRLVNSAYKEMVGEPECSWLDSLTATTCKRICGEVVIQLCDTELPSASNGFSCWVRIEWGSKGSKKCVNTFCDVIKLSCDSNNYQFTWRFHTRNVDGSIFCTTQ